MKALSSYHLRGDAGYASVNAGPNHRGDLTILKKRALERWENEGGKIPGLCPITEMVQTSAYHLKLRAGELLEIG
jgi:hypothetical protein